MLLCQNKHSRHDGSSFVQKENVSDGDRRDRLRGSSAKSHQDPAGQEATVRVIKNEPYCACKVDGVARNVDWPSAKLVGERHPEEVAHPLEQGGCREEVSSSGDCETENISIGGGCREELQGCI